MNADHSHDPTCLKKAAIDSVGYELRMMGAMARPLTDGQPGSELVRNALLEAYLTHVRCLHEFLSFKPPRSRHPHTVRAVHYFDAAPGPFPCLDEGVYESICQKLSHVTCARVPGHDWSGPDGDIGHLAVRVFEAFDAFLDALDAVGRADRRRWFEDDLAQGRVDFAAAVGGAFVFGRVTE